MGRCSSEMGLRPALNFGSCFHYLSQKGLLLGWVDSRTDMDVVMKIKFSVVFNLSRRRIPGLQHAFPVQRCHENSCHYRGFFKTWTWVTAERRPLSFFTWQLISAVLWKVGPDVVERATSSVAMHQGSFGRVPTVCERVPRSAGHSI